MVNSMVERATSGLLVGPDWAANLEICDVLNRDLSQSKDILKGIKKKIGSKNSKTQLLALTLLETIIKNCGDIVHMHVADRDVLHEMVRIAKKRSDTQVRDKILILIDTWQEEFGGPRARYPQYYAAYQELLRAGAVFPQRSEQSVPIFTPPQTQPLTSHPQNLRNSDFRQDTAESSSRPEFPTLSLTEIQNAHGIIDVLTEMLNALELGDIEGLRQDVIVDLMDQCQTYKQSVVQLVNSTSDESLLCQGLALNDDLQRLLAKHEAIASGIPAENQRKKSNQNQPDKSNQNQQEKSKAAALGALVDLDGPVVETGNTGKQKSNGSILPVKAGPSIDLLSGDDYDSPKADNSLALVLVGDQQPASPLSEQNAIVLYDMFSDANNVNTHPVMPTNVSGQVSPLAPQVQQQQILYTQGGFYSNGSAAPYYQPAWNGQVAQQQQPSTAVYGSPSGGSFPPPPWETQTTDNSQYPQPVQVTHVIMTRVQNPQAMGNEQVVGVHMPQNANGHMPAISPHVGQSNPFAFYPQQIQASPLPSMSPQQMNGNQYGGYGYVQQQVQYLEQKMHGISVRDDGGFRNASNQVSTSSYPTPGKPSKPEDKLFGDLVDMAKVKPPTPGPAASL